jgi:hypothetical protein
MVCLLCNPFGTAFVCGWLPLRSPLRLFIAAVTVLVKGASASSAMFEKVFVGDYLQLI